MKRADIVRKIAAAEKEYQTAGEVRKSAKEKVLALQMLLEMCEAGQLDLLEDVKGAK